MTTRGKTHHERAERPGVGLSRDLSTPDGRKFWAAVDRAVERVERLASLDDRIKLAKLRKIEAEHQLRGQQCRKAVGL